jgi:superfamily I DNA/RNA helicase
VCCSAVLYVSTVAHPFVLLLHSIFLPVNVIIIIIQYYSNATILSIHHFQRPLYSIKHSVVQEMSSKSNRRKYESHRISELGNLCTQRGIDTSNMLEKSELIHALMVSDNSNDSWTSSSSSKATKSDVMTYESMKVSQLRLLCEQRGIKTQLLLEKSEFIHALRTTDASSSSRDGDGSSSSDNNADSSTAGVSTEYLTLPGITLTKEQTDILDTCPPPFALVRAGKGKMVRVTAAAGTGKTTTLLHLALRAMQLGHQKITYLTFTRAAATDGSKRLYEAINSLGRAGFVTVDARTLHSFATTALNDHRKAQNPHADTGNKIWSDKKVQNWISDKLDREIDDFLEPCYMELQRRHEKGSSGGGNLQLRRKIARDRVEFFIYKNLNLFCTRPWSLRDFQDRKTFGRVYYPADQFHKDPQKGAKLGFEPRIYNMCRVHWYADQACKLWEHIIKDDIRTFDFIMKRAQLLKLKIPGTILLVDESQDMDGCQVDWVASQVKLSKHVYVVGDTAQSIYGFRGAKPDYVTDLDIDAERFLTESWRFGPGIVNIANLVLYAKHYSDQTSKKWDRRKQKEVWKGWSPYRVKAGMDKPSVVTSAPLLPDWRQYKEKSEKITLIARQNKTLFVEALSLFNYEPTSPDNQQGGNDDDDLRTQPINTDEDYDYLDDDDDAREEQSPPSTTTTTTSKASIRFDGNDVSAAAFPRIHINGYGENSGRKAWMAMFKLIGVVYELYLLSGEDNEKGGNSAPAAKSMRLPEKLFPEFAMRNVTWDELCSDVADREMNRYAILISVVKTFKHQTMKAVEVFQQEIIAKNYSYDEADIVLSTCHSSKGMEFDHVQVASDFIELASYVEDDAEQQQQGGKPPPSFEPASKRMKTFQEEEEARKWKFGFPSWGDDINLMYVACTRAKHTLSVPESIVNVITDFDTIEAEVECISEFQSGGDKETPTIQGLKCETGSTVNRESLRRLRDSLLSNLRAEQNIPSGRKFQDHFMNCMILANQLEPHVEV